MFFKGGLNVANCGRIRENREIYSTRRLFPLYSYGYLFRSDKLCSSGSWTFEAVSKHDSRLYYVSKAKEFYQTWLEQQEGEIPEESRLKFSKTWIKGWMKEYGVSLLKPNKRFSISKTDRKDRIIELLKNVWRVRYWFRSKLGREITIINGDQMLLHRNENASKDIVFHWRNYLCQRKLHAATGENNRFYTSI